MSLFPMLALALLFLATWLIFAGLRGVSVLTAPRCRKCGYDLRGHADAPPTRCSECGADLTKPNTVLFGARERRPQRVAAGVALLFCFLLLPLLSRLAGISSTGSPWPVGSPPSLPGATTAALLTQLPQHANEPWHWRELEQRLKAGTLSNADTAAAIDVLAKAMTSGNTGGVMAWSKDFVRTADAAGKIDAAHFDTLVHGVYGSQATVRVRQTVHAGELLEFHHEYGTAFGLDPLEFVKAVREVRVDGGTATLHAHDSDAALDTLSATWPPITGRVTIDAPPGPHTLTFVLDAALLTPGSRPSFNGHPGQAARWPAGRAKWTIDTPVPVTVLPAAQPDVKLETNPKFDPVASGRLRVTAIRVTATEKGPRVTADVVLSGKTLAQAYRVAFVAGGKSYDLATVSVALDADREYAATGVAGDLPAAAAVGDLVFTPDPSQRSTDNRIWGGVVRVSNVPLQRFDLPGGKATSMP